MRLSGRDDAQIRLVEAYAKAQGLWHDDTTPHAEFSTTLELDLADVKPSLAGPKRPQDRVLLEGVQKSFLDALGPLTANRKPRSQETADFIAEGGSAAIGNPANGIINGGVRIEKDGASFALRDGSVVIAAITSCTNTSNPAVMLPRAHVQSMILAILQQEMRQPGSPLL